MIYVYIYYIYKKIYDDLPPGYVYIYIYTKHNLIIYPWIFSYSHSYAFRWIQRCSDLPSVPAVRSTRASDWLPPARVAPVGRSDYGEDELNFEVFNQWL